VPDYPSLASCGYGRESQRHLMKGLNLEMFRVHKFEACALVISETSDV